MSSKQSTRARRNKTEKLICTYYMNASSYSAVSMWLCVENTLYVMNFL
jgi:hypothetical protein